MARDLARRIGALEEGNGTIGIGDLLDALHNKAVDYREPSTWPAAWRGKAMDTRTLAALDGLDPAFDRLTSDQVEARVQSRTVTER